ncbi:MAG: hypothetical protein Q4D51_12200 [Eubacteriales bacterium]|nr:hypothetical protein [Eubacteriales bacterium]
MEIRFHEKLYKDGMSNRKIRTIQRIVKKGKVPFPVFLITLPIGKQGILEVYWYPELMQTAYKKMETELVVVGIATQRAQAFELISLMISDAVADNNDISVKEFFGEYS